MIKECLRKLKTTNIGSKYNEALTYMIDNVDDYQLQHMLSLGVVIGENRTTLYYYHSVGFRCVNDETRVGRLPDCSMIEKRTNKYLLEMIRS
jgi:hypothetical protein